MRSPRVLCCIFLAAFFAAGASDRTVNRSGHARRHHATCHDPRISAESPLNDSMNPIVGLEPPDLASKLLPCDATDDDPLYVMFNGDPQYHFPCTNENTACKRHSEACWKIVRDDTIADLYFSHKKISMQTLATHVMSRADRCAASESKFANDVQRRAIFGLNRRLTAAGVAIVALVINGDLTNYGHEYQLQLFKDEWLSLPIPIFAGLGNHDYEMNVDDCANNQCAHRMLSWFVDEYAPKLGLALDHAESNLLWKSQHQGSLAYSVNFCSRTRTNCVHSIQLNNRADYGRQIDAFDSVWDIRPSLGWLAAHLSSAELLNNSSSWPILINVHDNERDGTSAPRLNVVIRQWLERPENKHRIRRVMVLFAHMHNRHDLTVQCIAGVKIPFIYVGSVSNNRYTIIKFSGDVATVVLMRANFDATTTVIDVIEYRWTPC